GASGPVAGIWEYSTDLFDEATIDRFAGHFMTLLAAAAADPAKPLSDLTLLTADEQEQIAAWNRTGAGESGDGLLTGLVRPWVERTPDAPAVLQDGRSLSYAALWSAAERLARRLRSLDVGAEIRVAICLDETIERIVAVLGVVLAGGAGYGDDRSPAARSPRSGQPRLCRLYLGLHRAAQRRDDPPPRGGRAGAVDDGHRGHPAGRADDPGDLVQLRRLGGGGLAGIGERRDALHRAARGPPLWRGAGGGDPALRIRLPLLCAGAPGAAS